MPSLFGLPLGEFADRKRGKAVLIALASAAVFLFVLSVMDTYVWQLVVVFCIGLVRELILLSEKGMMARVAKANHYGRLNGGMNELRVAGQMLGPILLGFLIDSTTLFDAFLILSCLFVLLFVFFLTKLHILETQTRLTQK